MVLLGLSSDRTGERHSHIAGPALLACIGLCFAAFAHSPATTLAALSLAQRNPWKRAALFLRPGGAHG